MAWHEYEAFTSSNLNSVRYDEDTQTLEVSFNNGGTYQYFDVPSHVSSDFERAESKGKFLAEHIKGNFRYSKA